jgi:hypothetical protein
MSLITMQLYYLKRYTNQVEYRYAKLKMARNLCLPTAIFALGFNFIFGLLIYINKAELIFQKYKFLYLYN